MAEDGLWVGVLVHTRMRIPSTYMQKLNMDVPTINPSAAYGFGSGDRDWRTTGTCCSPCLAEKLQAPGSVRYSVVRG